MIINNERRKNSFKLFVFVAVAYEVLANPEKRSQYDQGNMNFQGHQQQSDFNYEEFYKKFDEAQQRHYRAHHKAHEEAVRKAHAKTQKMHDRMKARGFFHEEDFFDDFFDDDLFLEGEGGEANANGDVHVRVNADGSTQHVHTKTSHSVKTERCHTVTSVNRETGATETKTICTTEEL
jgi:curved DNA-binding protein CbpA